MDNSKEEEYKEMFLSEALENYEELNNFFTDLEKNTSNKKIIDAIFRITHTLKGNAMGMGFKEIADLGHVMEDIFSEVKERRIVLDDELFTSLFKANDKLGELIDAITSGKEVRYKGIRTKLSVLLSNAKEEEQEKESVPENIEVQSEAEPNIEIQAEEIVQQDPIEEEEKIEVEEPKKEENTISLFERVGGQEAIDATVAIFYDKVLADKEIRHFFESTDMEKQKAKQKVFLSYVFGGPVKYTGKDMRNAHAHLVVNGLNESHFNAVAGHLVASLEELLVPQELIDEIVAIALSVKDEVLAGPEIEKEKLEELDDKKEQPVAETNVEEKIEIEEKEEELDVKQEQPVAEEEEEEEEEDSQPKIAFSDLVKVPVRKLDNLLNLVGELIIERDSLIAASVERGQNTNSFDRLQRITSDLQYGVMDVRMVQVGFLFNKFNRIIRDVAVIENKKVNLILEGTEIEIDRNILKIMSDSLVHLVRNSVSHGVESSEERKKKGKPAEGQVILSARNEKDTIIIDVSDDGNGIDHKVIGKKAVEKGIITQKYADAASKDELLMLIFEPGFSNAEKITEVSGRGVGMDVVRRATESIGGNIKVTTVIGKGSTITLSLPSSMAVKGALLFELKKQEYAVALSYTEAVVSLTKSDIHKVSGGFMADYLGNTISIVFLNDLAQLTNLTDLSEEVLHKTYNELIPNQKLEVLITSYGNKCVGFVVDKLLQQQEIVEKTLAKPLDNIDLISGATILGKGNVCLVLDVANIINTMYKDREKKINLN